MSDDDLRRALRPLFAEWEAADMANRVGKGDKHANLNRLIDAERAIAVALAARSELRGEGLRWTVQDVGFVLDGIREEVRQAVAEGDAQDCSSPDCIADAVYEIVRVRLCDAATSPAPMGSSSVPDADPAPLDDLRWIILRGGLRVPGFDHWLEHSSSKPSDPDDVRWECVCGYAGSPERVERHWSAMLAPEQPE